MDIIEQPYGCFVSDKTLNRYDVFGGDTYFLLKEYISSAFDIEEFLQNILNVYKNADYATIKNDIQQLVLELNTKGYTKNIIKQANFIDNDRQILKPVSIEIEITHQCNLHCAYCYADSTSKYAAIDLDSWINILNLFHKKHARVLTITGGEPLLYNHLITLIDQVHEKYIIEINTNGTYVDKHFINNIKKFNVKAIQVSLDSPSRDIHDLIRGNGSWKAAFDAIKLLRNAYIPVRISMTLHKLNAGLVFKMNRLANFLGCELSITPMNPVGRGSILEESLEYSKGYQKEYPEKSYLSPLDICCFSQMGYISVDPYGTIKPCNISKSFFDSYSKNICKFSSLNDDHIDLFLERHTTIFNSFYSYEKKPSHTSHHDCIVCQYCKE